MGVKLLIFHFSSKGENLEQTQKYGKEIEQTLKVSEKL